MKLQMLSKIHSTPCSVVYEYKNENVPICDYMPKKRNSFFGVFLCYVGRGGVYSYACVRDLQ